MKATHRFALALGAMGVLTTGLFAQEPRPAAPPGTQPAAGRSQHKNLDSHFAACLVLQNQNEIAVAKLAEQRSKSPEVKKFAQMLQKDHQQFLGDVEKFGGTQFRDRRPAASTASGEEPKAQPSPARAATNPAQSARPGQAAAADDDQHLQIKREIADECIASAQRELSSKEGREFDACFVGMQIGMHQMLVDELKVLERHASAELQPTLKKGRESAQSHLERAKEIMKDIDRGDTRTTAK